MNTNQTIDGVPRELAEDAAEAFAAIGMFDRLEELRALLDAPEVLVVPLTGPKEWLDSLKPAAQPQGEPVHICQKCNGRGSNPTRHAGEGETEYRACCKLYAKQPASVAVVMPERRDPKHYWGRFGKLTAIARVAAEEWNACRDDVTRLNSTRPTHANPPPGIEPSGTHHDNDGLDEWRKPTCCGSCPAGCVIQKESK